MRERQASLPAGIGGRKMAPRGTPSSGTVLLPPPEQWVTGFLSQPSDFFRSSSPPFALAGAWIFAGGTAGALLLITGIRGVVRTYRRTATGPSDPYDIVRDWAAGRREAFFDRELSLLGASAGDKEREEFVASTYAAWWGGSSSASTN